MSNSGHYPGGSTLVYPGSALMPRKSKKNRKKKPSRSASASNVGTTGSAANAEPEKQIPRRTGEAAITLRTGDRLPQWPTRNKPPSNPRTSADHQRTLRMLREHREGRLPVDAQCELDRLLGGRPVPAEIPIWIAYLEAHPVTDPIMAERASVKPPPNLSASNSTAPDSKASSKPVTDSGVPDTWNSLGAADRTRLLALLLNRSQGDLNRTKGELEELAGRYPSQQQARNWHAFIKTSLKERSDMAATLAQLKQKQAQLLAHAARARQEAEKAEQDAQALGEEIGKLEQELR